jgi:hypothetical protein
MRYAILLIPVLLLAARTTTDPATAAPGTKDTQVLRQLQDAIKAKDMVTIEELLDPAMLANARGMEMSMEAIAGILGEFLAEVLQHTVRCAATPDLVIYFFWTGQDPQYLGILALGTTNAISHIPKTSIRPLTHTPPTKPGAW